MGRRFLRQFRMDMARSVFTARFAVLVLALALFLCLSDVWQMYLSLTDFADVSSVADILYHDTTMDKYRIFMVIFMSSVYAGSFCTDYKSTYLRGILARTDAAAYARSRFLANTLTNVLGSAAGYLLVTLVLSLRVPLVTEDFARSVYNGGIALAHPLCYILILAAVFGMVAAACSSVGLMFSAFRPNRFVSIALPGMVFFLLMSYMPMNNAFDMLGVLYLLPVLTHGSEAGLPDYLWHIAYPAAIIFICGYVFRKQIERRVRNGKI